MTVRFIGQKHQDPSETNLLGVNFQPIDLIGGDRARGTLDGLEAGSLSRSGEQQNETGAI